MFFLRGSLNQVVPKHNQLETEGAKFKHCIFLDITCTYQLEETGHTCVPLKNCRDNGMRLKKRNPVKIGTSGYPKLYKSIFNQMQFESNVIRIRLNTF